jgi:hypothetical protein
MEAVYAKEESKRLRGQLGSLRDRMTDLDARVTNLFSLKAAS